MPLKKTVIDFNFDERCMRILRDMLAPKEARSYSAESATNGLWYLPLTIASDDPRPKLNVVIDNVSVKLLIDTGSGANIILRHETFEKMVESGAIERRGQTGKIAVGAGFVDEQSGRFTRGSFLGHPLTGLRVNDGVTTDSVGMRLLMNWNFMIDLQNKRFYFSRGKSSMIDLVACLGIGWQFDDDHACYVQWVNTASEAAKPPAILAGDRILKLGPLSAGDLNVFSIYELCLRNSGKPITVEFLHPSDQQSITKPLTRYLLLHQ
jgi:hypothetical protein